MYTKREPSGAGGHKEKTRDGPSPPTPKSTVIGLVSPQESRERQGRDEGSRVVTYEGAERSIWKSAESDDGQSDRSDHTGGPRDSAIKPKEAKETQAEGTDADVEDPHTKQKRVREAEREEEHVKGSREDQNASTCNINTEGRHAIVLNRELDRSSDAKDEEDPEMEAATKGTSATNGRGGGRARNSDSDRP